MLSLATVRDTVKSTYLLVHIVSLVHVTPESAFCFMVWFSHQLTPFAIFADFVGKFLMTSSQYRQCYLMPR